MLISGHYCDTVKNLPDDFREFVEDKNSKGFYSLNIYKKFNCLI